MRTQRNLASPAFRDPVEARGRRRVRVGCAVLVACTLLGPGIARSAPGDISTIVGGPGQGDALVVYQDPAALVVSSSTVFVAEEFRGIIRAVDRATGLETVYAGRPDAPCPANPSGDDGGPASGAVLCGPSGLALDPAGDLLVADTAHSRVRKIDGVTGVISTVAGGNGLFGGDGGPANAAGLCSPRGIAVDPAGNLFIADECDHRIRRVDATTGIISTVAGTGLAGFSGDGGLATAATLASPKDVSVDSSSNVFIADRANSRVRRVDATTGIITTFAGNGTSGSTGTNGPATAAALAFPTGVLVDDVNWGGDVFIAEAGAHKVRRVRASDGVIVAFAGNGSSFSGGDGGAASVAAVPSPLDVAVADDAHIFIAAGPRVREVNSGVISTVAGKTDFDLVLDGVPATDTQLDLDYPGDVTFDAAGNLYFTDTYNSRIRRVDAVTGLISTVAGNGSQGYNGEFVPASDVWIFFPSAVAVDAAGNVYYTDTTRIRVIDATSGLVHTIAGNNGCGYSGDGGPALLATICYANDLLFDGDGNLLIADTDNRRVRRIQMSSGEISTIAGNGSSIVSGDGGPALTAGLGYVQGLALDGSGNLFVSDGNDRVRRIAAGTTTVSTVAGGGSIVGDGVLATSALIDTAYGVAVDHGGNLVIAELGAHRVRLVDATAGLISTVAGDGQEQFSGDGGPGPLASLIRPAAVAVDPFGGIVIFDTGNHRLRRIEPPPCGNGLPDLGEQCDLGPLNGSASSCCTSTCAFRSAASTCRPAAGACDLSETCDGLSPHCPSDATEPDSDGDGACDSTDLCTNVAGGRDLAVKPSLALSRINVDPIAGNDRLVLSGEFDLPTGVTFADLDPSVSGARLIVFSASDVRRVDVTLAPGSYGGAGTRGWERRANGWYFIDATGSPVNGIVKARLRERAGSGPHRVGLSIQGRRGGYPVAPGDQPLGVGFIMGGQAASAAGLCTELEFGATECRFNSRGDGLRCRR